MPKKKAAARVRRVPKGTAGPAVELREAAREGDTGAVKSLAVLHMVDDTDERGFTALLWAAWNGHARVMEILLDKGADRDYCDEDGQTALFHACWFGHTAAAAVLLQRGADPNVADSEGETPLSAAARSGSYETVKLLMQHNADPRGRDKDGHNAVSRALKKGHRNIAVLIEDYARVYAPQGGGAAVQCLLDMSAAREQRYAQEQVMMQQYVTPAGVPPRENTGFREAVAGLDSLNQQLHAMLRSSSPHPPPPPPGSPQAKGSYESLIVISGDTVRLNGSGRLPPVGSSVHLNATSTVVWRVLTVVKGGGVKLQAVPGNANVTSVWGEPGDEANAGLWQAVPELPVQQQMVKQVQQEQPLQQVPVPGAPRPLAAHQYKPFETFQQEYHQKQPQQYCNPNHFAFGAVGAREAAMPLQGMPPPGSPRRSTYRKSRYKKDNPCYRARNSCTVCLKVRPPLNFCEECNEEMCGGCWVREHQNRKRRLHIPHPVEVVYGDDSGEEEDDD